MIPAIARFIFNLVLFAAALAGIWLMILIILRGLRYALQYIGLEVNDFTSWMTKPVRDFIEWRKSK